MKMVKENELIDYLQAPKHIILYGAGMVGGLVKSRLDSNNLGSKIACFVKSVVSRHDTYMGINVLGLDSLGSQGFDGCILVCALSATQKEMIRELEIRGIHSYIPVSEELFLDLQEHYLAEQRSLNTGICSNQFDVIFFSQDNNATSGAFISMAGLCSEIQKQSGLKVLVILPRYGDGEKILKGYDLEYTYMNRETEWIGAVGLSREKQEKLGSAHKIYQEDEVKRLRKLIQATGARLVHISGMFVFAGAIAAKEEGIPVVWHIRENIATQGNGFINPKAAYELLNASGAVVCVSHHVRQAYPGLNGDVVRVIYNGADADLFYENREIFRSSVCRIVMVGHITRLKGQEILVKALECLKDGNERLPHVTFVGGGDSRYLESLTKAVADAGLEKYVTFAGRTLEPEIYYRQSDIAVSATSGGEGFDRVRIEAMLSGCLLIANDIGAAREIVKDGETGYLYENGSAKSLAEAIANAQKDIGRSRAIAARGQQLCMERFTKRHNAEQVLVLYKEIMGADYGRPEGVPAEF